MYWLSNGKLLLASWHIRADNVPVVEISIAQLAIDHFFRNVCIQQ